VPTQSDGLESLNDFIDLRDRIREKRIGHGGHEVCDALASTLDKAIANLLPDASGMAAVAIGGYGRGELSPFSDVDLMLLHDVDDAADAAATLFRPLWDAGLRVGHAVRTVKEAAAAARERFDTQTTLLTSRLIAGDEALFSQLGEEITAVTKARPLRRHLVEEERARRADSPFLLMASDVKVGRGGLRTLHGFEWERRREELIGKFLPDTESAESGPRENLLRIRNALHAVTGRPHDTFSPELREPVARWLGLDTMETARLLVESLTVVDRLASKRWPEVLEETSPRRRRVWPRRQMEKPSIDTTKVPGLADLVTVLGAGERGRVAFHDLWGAGLLADVLPEWEVVESLPQIVPFHEHPVAAHLWRTVDEMKALVGSEGHYAGVASEVDADDVLTLSAFLHDIGKGHGGNHAVVGADIARAVCDRLAVDWEKTRLITEAVRHHLLLAVTATRRDVDDPAVIDEVAAKLGDLRLLQVLYLLTVADSKATGPGMWNEWKEVLVRTLFVRCATRFGADRPVETGVDIDDVLSSVASDRHPEVTAHIAGMPAEYLRSVGVEDVVWHVDLISSVSGPARIDVRPGSPFETAVVVGPARSGFRRLVAGAFAANGVDVLEARLLTRSDGMVVDTFRVRDDRTGESIPPDRWEKLESDIEEGLGGEADPLSKAAARAAAYPEPGSAIGAPKAAASFDPASGDLVLTVKCSDRIGRLAEILTVLGDCGLDIRLAKLDSRAGEIVDTFHVTTDTVSDEPRALSELGDRIAGAITP
jgi:[protein-PII] uridylyltransferase